MTIEVSEFLQTRRSVVAKKMISTPPSDEHLKQILNCGLRVPDHSSVQPWRIIILQGDARRKFSEQVILPAAQARSAVANETLSDTMIAMELDRMQRGGTVISVLSKPSIPHKIPVWEQQLSAGAMCSHLLIATQSLGYAAQWITEWPAYDHSVIKALGGNPQHDIVAGFIHIGRKESEPTERKRPVAADIIRYWS